MPQLHPVTLVGFSAFERNVLGSALRLSGQRLAAYTLVEQLDEARFVVADTDSSGTLEALQEAGRVRDTVFIGAQAPENAPAWMMRPIDAAKVLHELDLMASRSVTAGSAPASGPADGGPSRRPGPDAGPARRASDLWGADRRRRS
jgi:hypothetical protein